jgi:hypothetical protein
MAQNRRVALTMPPHLDAVLDDLSRLQHKPKTAVIVDFLQDIYPAAVQLRDALLAVEEGQKPDKAMAALFASMSAQYADIIQDYTALKDD